MQKGAQSPVALSLKQPWAALTVAGLKSIEVRRWKTARTGPVLIHAARVPDDRPEAWRNVPEALQPLAQLRGGIIGAVELTECIQYTTLRAFEAHLAAHRNELEWFEPMLYGFVFRNPEILPFHRCPGWFRFFAVPGLVKSSDQPITT